MVLNPNDKEAKEMMQKDRRDFLKKVAYTAPALIILGQLVKPESANAGFSGPPSDPRGPAGSGPSGSKMGNNKRR